MAIRASRSYIDLRDRATRAQLGPTADVLRCRTDDSDGVWAAMQRDRAVVRVLLRDLDAHPVLLDDVWSAIRANAYDVFTAWLRAQADAGTVVVDDPEATGAVLLASLTYRPILDALIGHAPGDVDAARFRAAWVSHAMATLTR